jgi:hypothetical protein
MENIYEIIWEIKKWQIIMNLSNLLIKQNYQLK